MTSTQGKLTVAIVAVIGIAALFVLKNIYGGFSKHDVLGVVPGMTENQVQGLIKNRKWVCQPPAADALDCKTGAGQLLIGFAKTPESTTVTGVQVVLRNRENLSLSEIAKSISEQYARAPETRGDGASKETPKDYRWQLSNGHRLTLEAKPQMTLTLDAKASAAKP